MTRKKVTEDPAVMAAIEALKIAALAVNGDDEVVNLVIAIDMKAGKKGWLTTRADVCGCPSCLHRLEFAILDTLGDVRSQGPVAQHGHRKVH